MENKALVSILTPCYNNANIIYRLLDSVLAQSYPRIEMIVVNDGSTDDIISVIDLYITKFQQRGYSLNLIHQTNQGQSAAINNGLKQVKGKYLCWPDADDFYASFDAIERLVDAFGPEISMTRCEYNVVDENTLEPIRSYSVKEGFECQDLFEDCLFQKNGYWLTPGGYMVDMDIFDKEVPNRDIYVEKMAGQNWQMMLPLLYNHKCYTIKEKLFNYLFRTNSHSKPVNNSFEKRLAMLEIYERTITSTLDRIKELKENDKRRYLSEIEKKYIKIKFFTALKYKKNKESKYYLKLAETKQINIGYRYRYKIIGFLFKVLNKISMKKYEYFYY